MATDAKSGLDHTIAFYEQSMVRLVIKNRNVGNGFVVYSERATKLIMTCQHVVQGFPLHSEVLIHFSEICRGPAIATLVFFDERRDLALLKVNMHHPCNVVNFTNEPARPGQKVVLLAFFDMDDDIVVRPGAFPGEIMAEPTVVTPPPHLFELLRGSYSSKDGTSGAPVIELPGYSAIGVHIEAAMGMKSAVSVGTIMAALREQFPNAHENATMKSLLGRIARLKGAEREAKRDGGGRKEASSFKEEKRVTIR